MVVNSWLFGAANMELAAASVGLERLEGCVMAAGWAIGITPSMVSWWWVSESVDTECRGAQPS